MTAIKKSDIIAELQTDILRLQGFKSQTHVALDLGLGPIKNAFPKGTFPLGCIHEFLSPQIEDTASTSGFVSALLASIVGNNGIIIWISSSRMLFPPALKNFGIEPDRCIFIDLPNEKSVLWSMEEALKCSAVSAVVGEMKEISFTTSRRLQLAVEKSQVTGFILRKGAQKINTTACVSRWKISSLPCDPIDDLPGIGYPKWRVELLRIRNGKSGVWELQWMNGRFVPVHISSTDLEWQQKRAG